MAKVFKGKVNWGCDELKDVMLLLRRLAGEFIGTEILVWLALTTCFQYPPINTDVHTSLTVAFTVATVVQSLAHVSGAHVNPAVTLGFLVAGKISALRGLLYVQVQLGGAVMGAMLYKYTTPVLLQGVGLCSNRIDPSTGMTVINALVVEAILTFTLVLVILAVCDKHRRPTPHGTGPFIVGLAVAAIFLPGIKYSGAGFNPARSFGPALLGDYWENHYIYWAGPLMGGAVAGVVYRTCLKAGKPTKKPVSAPTSTQHRTLPRV